MNQFDRTVIAAINRHGIDATFSSVSTGIYDPATGTAANTSASYTIKVYKRQFTATQFNQPHLVGKETAMFYIAASLLSVVPKPQDRLEFNGKLFKLDSVQEHAAHGAVVLYRLIGVA